MMIMAAVDFAWRVALVALGSAVGGVLRYLVTIIFALSTKESGVFPWATLTVNVVGSFVIGLGSGLIARCCAGSLAGEWIRAVALIGFCGGFTTFSTFSNETFKLLQASHYGLALVYVLASVFAGLIAIALAQFIACAKV